jgi:hypothetical protein
MSKRSVIVLISHCHKHSDPRTKVACKHSRNFLTGDVPTKGVGSRLVSQSVSFQLSAVQGTPVEFEVTESVSQ